MDPVFKITVQGYKILDLVSWILGPGLQYSGPEVLDSGIPDLGFWILDPGDPVLQ